MSKETPFDLTESSEVPDLYTLLRVSRSATPDELRKAYRKTALLTHPDKWAHLDPTSTEAKTKTAEFQQIGFAYSVLKDPKRRKIYDQTGSFAEIPDVIEEGKDWDAYFRELWSGVVDADTIEQFSRSYKGSDEERRDIVAAYNTHDGDLDLIFTEVMLAEVSDEPRFVEIIEECIRQKMIKRTKTYTRSKKSAGRRREDAEKEAEEAEALRKELGLDDKLRKALKDKKKKNNNNDNNNGKRKRGQSDSGCESDDDDEDEQSALGALIRQREGNRMNAIIANIEAKYASENSKKAKKSKTNANAKSKGKGRGNKAKKQKNLGADDAFVEPSEEEFQALQAKLFGKK
ncbi:hypothetical protein J3B02_000748 [Coemansia erecta]|nr:hypothetical protein J3B02_000748 [Coemansia erecta]